MISVRRRIMLWFVGLSVIGWVVTMLAVWSQVSNEVDEVYDAYLVQTARQLAATLSPSAAPLLPTGIAARVEPRGHPLMAVCPGGLVCCKCY